MLAKWDDVSSDKHCNLTLSRHKSSKHWGLVLKQLNDLLSSEKEGKKAKESSMSRLDLLKEREIAFEALGQDWSHISTDLSSWERYLKKDSFEPF